MPGQDLRQKVTTMHERHIVGEGLKDLLDPDDTKVLQAVLDWSSPAEKDKASKRVQPAVPNKPPSKRAKVGKAEASS